MEKHRKAKENYMRNDTQTLKNLYEAEQRQCKKIIQRKKRKYLNILQNAKIYDTQKSRIFSEPSSNTKNLTQN